MNAGTERENVNRVTHRGDKLPNALLERFILTGFINSTYFFAVELTVFQISIAREFIKSNN